MPLFVTIYLDMRISPELSPMLKRTLLNHASIRNGSVVVRYLSRIHEPSGNNNIEIWVFRIKGNKSREAPMQLEQKSMEKEEEEKRKKKTSNKK